MLCPIVIGASHSFIKQMFIRSLLCSKDIGYVKVSNFEWRALYILTILSTGENTSCAQEIPSVDLLNVLVFGLEKNDHHFSDGYEKRRPIFCYECWVHTTCQVLCCGVHTAILISFLALPSLPFQPETQSLNKILLRISSQCGAETTHWGCKTNR